VGAVFEDVLPYLGPVRASPALGYGLVLRPLQVLADEAVARLQLVEPRGKPLGATGHRCYIGGRSTEASGQQQWRVIYYARGITISLARSLADCSVNCLRCLPTELPERDQHRNPNRQAKWSGVVLRKIKASPPRASTLVCCDLMTEES
jgi:hypothetical protein